MRSPQYKTAFHSCRTLARLGFFFGSSALTLLSISPHSFRTFIHSFYCYPFAPVRLFPCCFTHFLCMSICPLSCHSSVARTFFARTILLRPCLFGIIDCIFCSLPLFCAVRVQICSANCAGILKCVIVFDAFCLLYLSLICIENNTEMNKCAK